MHCYTHQQALMMTYRKHSPTVELVSDSFVRGIKMGQVLTKSFTVPVLSFF